MTNYDFAIMYGCGLPFIKRRQSSLLISLGFESIILNCETISNKVLCQKHQKLQNKSEPQKCRILLFLKLKR